MKQFEETNEYYFRHVAEISATLEWITKLTMAIATNTDEMVNDGIF